MAYPATFDVQMPKQFDKAQVVLRILIVIALSFLQVGNIVFGGSYLILPILAAVLISQKGSEKYLEEAQSGPVKWLRYVLMFYAYMALATDKLQANDPEEVIQFDVNTTGHPSVGNALMRLILAIPHAIVLFLLGIVLAIVWLVAAGSILVNGNQPGWTEDYIRSYLRWVARLLAYMASLVDEYPPFSLDNSTVTTEPAAQ